MSLSFSSLMKLCGGCLLALLVFFVSDSAAQPPVAANSSQVNQLNLETLRKSGFAHLRSGNWEAARSDFAAALKIAPQDVLTIYGSSLALFNLKNYPQAAAGLDEGVKILSRTQENNQLLADFWVLSAVISAVQNENTAAIEKLEKALKLVPQHFDAVFSLGRAYFGNGEIDKSVTSFRQAVSLQPKDARSRFFLATALERAGNNSEALSEYRKVLELSPESADGNLGLGVLLLKTEGDRSAEGLAALQKAALLNPNLYEARITLGKTLIKLNRAAEAVEHLQKAAELAPNNPEPHFQLAIAYRKLGKKSEAEAENAIVKRIHESRRGTSSQNP